MVPLLVGCGDTGGTTGQRFPCTEQGIRDAIAEGGGPHTFDCDGPDTVVTEAEIVIDNDVVLDGAGSLTVDGNGEHRVFSVADGAKAELRGFTVTNGQGGIHNSGTVTVTSSTVSGNHTVGRGGGLYNGGTMMLLDTTVSGNTAEEEAGGIFNSYGTLTLTNSSVSGNKIVNSETPWREDETLVNLRGVMTLVNSTVSGMIYAEGGPSQDVVAVVVSAATLIRGSCSATEPDFGPVEWVSDGYNIESPGNTCGFDQPTDQVNVSADDLKLGQLADNGGPTMTHALLPGSVAIDVIPADMCEVDKDQRGEPRDSMCDVGAFEVQP
jgi:hypothetical protein